MLCQQKVVKDLSGLIYLLLLNIRVFNVNDSRLNIRNSSLLWLWFAIKTLADKMIMVNFHDCDNCEYKHQRHKKMSSSITYSHVDFLIYLDFHKMNLHLSCDTKILLNKTYKEKWVCFSENLRVSSIFEWL